MFTRVVWWREVEVKQRVKPASKQIRKPDHSPRNCGVRTDRETRTPYKHNAATEAVGVMLDTVKQAPKFAYY